MAPISTNGINSGIEVELVPRLKQQGYAPELVEQRRRWVEEKTGCELRHVGACSVSTEQMRGNIENPVGAAQVPLGVAGPLLVRGEHADGTFYVPLATTEGALIRSYERGMVTLTRSGAPQCVCTWMRIASARCSSSGVSLRLASSPAVWAGISRKSAKLPSQPRGTANCWAWSATRWAAK